MSEIEDILKNTPLKERLRISFEMRDADNWIDGEYHGNVNEYVDLAIGLFEEYIDELLPSEEEKEKRCVNYIKFTSILATKTAYKRGWDDVINHIKNKLK